MRLTQRIEAANTISTDNQDWLLNRLAELKTAYDNLPPGLPRCVVHGDAWSGNIVTTTDSTIVVLDLERCSLGPPEWDLVSTAVAYVSTARIDTKEWDIYCQTYGHDVTTWDPPGTHLGRLQHPARHPRAATNDQARSTHLPHQSRRHAAPFPNTFLELLTMTS